MSGDNEGSLPRLGFLPVLTEPPGCSEDAVAQDFQDKEEAGEEDEAEQAHPLLDPHEDGEHNQIQRQAQALAPHKARVLKSSFSGSSHGLLHFGLSAQRTFRSLNALRVS
ncbi:hypothetical protein AXF42_Ash005843 [Apostasia shenzhenica]|uniref:Uncharacterized protein n=1 Tax=Apostasia shenzhenica TaxID=1088818 RepID=A0A2I0BCI7_9ASPA|nr:hypothetical protein AXF42_Ash005843 [Apostasia shenzhenica]